MNLKSTSYFFGILFFVLLPLYGQEVVLSAKETFHLYLLAGQSNMAGRGIVTGKDQETHPRVLALSKEGEWELAVDPIHYDKPVAGVGLGKSFALALATENPEIAIGLIPAACGGSPIETWEPGGYHGQTQSHPYDDAIKRAKRAMRDGVLKGILWHQGESDSNAERAYLYKDRLRALIKRFRDELGDGDLPFIIGQLGKFPENPWNQYRAVVNDAHIDIAKEMRNVGFVISDGLTCKADNVHFDAYSLRRFGRRYADVYLDAVR